MLQCTGMRALVDLAFVFSNALMAYQQGAGNAFVKPEPTEGAVPPPHVSQNTNANATWDELVKRTEEDPFSESAWDGLLDYAEESGDNEKIKTAYDALLQKYPNIVSVVLRNSICVLQDCH